MRSRRILAKLIDLIACAGFVSLGQRLGGTAWTGFALGAAYLLAGDAWGMSAKSWFGLAVVDVATGRRCSLMASALRNTPWLAAPLFRTAVTAFGGSTVLIDGVASAPSPAMSMARGVVGLLGLAITMSLWRGLGDGSGRHWADRWADTKVIKTDITKRETRAATAKAPAEDPDAVDFDDAERSPAAHGGATGRPRSINNNSAVDFDDAAN